MGSRPPACFGASPGRHAGPCPGNTPSDIYQVGGLRIPRRRRLQAYIRQVLLNRIRGELRRAASRPAGRDLQDEHVDQAPSPLEAAIGREGMERYEAALTRLRPSDREAIIARFELGMNNQELAVALGKPTADAARRSAERAVRRLIEEMASE